MQIRLSIQQALRRLAGAALPVAIALACQPSAEAQILTLRFRHLNTENGLSQSAVMAVLQDRRGFIWLGTQDGLDRYDGSEFRHFRHHADDPLSVSSNHVRALAEDRSGRLWIGTDATGLDRYDPLTGQFLNFRHRPEVAGSLAGNRVRALALDSNGWLWVATGEDGLSHLDPNSGQAINYRHDPADPGSLIDDHLTSLLVDSRGLLWIGSRRGLDCFDPKTGSFQHFPHDANREDSLGEPSVRAIFEDSRGRIFVGTHGGLDLLDRARGTFRHFRPDPANPYALGNPPVRALIEDSYGRLWVGTDQGIHIFDEVGGRFERHRSDRANAASLSQDPVTTFYRDRSGLLWVGTQGGGANIWDPASRAFNHVLTRPGDRTSLSSDNIQAFAEIGSTLYIGTLGGGLNALDRSSGEFTVFRPGPGANRLAEDRVMALASSRQGQLWVGTYNSGLQRFDPRTGRFETWRHDPDRASSLASDSIAALLEDRLGRLWIGSFFGGLDRYEPATGEFVHYRNVAGDASSLPNDAVTSLAQAADGGLYIGTNGGGLAYLTAAGDRLFRLDSPNEDELEALAGIRSLYVDPRGSLWVGTAEAGLILIEAFDPASGKATLRRYTENEGGPNGTVWGIQPDSTGHLWLSTNRGLVELDPAEGKFRSYSARHGLQGDEFNFGAHFRSARGELYFGGNHGFNFFFPERLLSSSSPPAVVLTSIVKRDTVVRPESLVDASQEIELDHHDSVVSIEFAALDFSAPEENRFRFRLEGFDDGWSLPTRNRSATFTNLDPGRYTFRVTAANPDGVWNRDGAALVLRVLPAPWETWWAISLYALAGAGLVWQGIRWRLAGLERSRQSLQVLVDQRTGELSTTVEQLRVSEQSALDAKMRALRALEDALEERRKAQEASRAKSTFLSNISHELRTPLNAVLGFAQLLERDETLASDHRESLGVILRSGEHLLGLINDVLSFAKIESGRLTLSEAAFELRRMIRDVEDMIRVRADAKGLKLEVEVESALPNVLGDEGRLTQILLNLLGNAVKFTSQGSVRLVVSWHEGRASFKVIDTGCGIDEAELGQLFQPFVQASGGRQHGEGTGLGLAICHKLISLMGGELEVRSQVGVGSTFRFAIPLPATALSEKAERRGRVVGLAATPSPVKILIADDASENRDLLVRLLQPLGIEVRAVGDGQAAVEVWSSWRPQLILMDIRMPVLDGYGAIRKIRQTEAELGGRTLIVAITATAFEHDRRRMLTAGCDDVLTKPFRSQALFDLLAEQLDLRFLYSDEPRQAPDSSSAEAAGKPAAAPAAAAPEKRPAVAVPAAAATATAPPPAATAERPRSSEISFAGARILVVDDNDANRLVAQRALERLGCRVDLAGDGLEAIAAASVVRYDLIFMDVQMPRLDGISATKKLRAEAGPSQETPVVALTGLPSPDEYRRCLSAGMSDLLAKPFRLDDLRLQVERWALLPGGAAARVAALRPEAVTASSGKAGTAGREAAAAGSEAGSRDAPAAPLPAADGGADDQNGDRALEDTREVYVAEIIKLFLETAPFQLEALRTAAASFDLARLAHLAATLRGSSLNFSATELATACQRLEDLCAADPPPAGQRQQVESAIEELSIQLQATIGHLRQLQANRAAARSRR